VTLPLLSDRKLLNEYISTSGGVRIGKLMENLDVRSFGLALHSCPASHPLTRAPPSRLACC
jgi:hypothetical protein